ncbi:MAG: Gfo/Idh/MocA family oxidoreductase [Bacilli bacterium]|nr:Gfo/Idh/MocA family oxidoreductase [Bacilli bacterium]
MERVRVGFVGLGQRGKGMLDTFLAVPDVDVVAVCDVYADRVDSIASTIKEKRGMEARKYTDFNLLLEDKELDAIYIATSWEAHIDQAIMCMKKGIPCAMEVAGAYSIKDCWRLVKAYEKTKTPIMMMENCCYDKFELLCTALARKGVFGEIVYCHGAYTHDLRKEILGGNVNRHYRLRNYIARNCENYPTHELGPIAKILNINRGNRMVYVSSVASKSKGLSEYAKSDACEDKTLKDVTFKQGDVVSTNIICENGETITMTLNTSLPAHYSREIQVKGTKGCADMDTNMVLEDGSIDESHWNPAEFNKIYFGNAEKYYEEYLPSFWKNITQEEISLGHGGMDIFLVRAFIECLKNGEEMPIDVYDAAAWYSITPLSEKSIKHHGKPYKIPDFTRGKYKNRPSKDVIKL